MGMKLKTSLLMLSLVILVTVMPVPKTVASSPLPQYSGGISVSGLVDNPLNLTDADLLSLPMVSEMATIECVWYNVPGSPATITVNWTGIPLFYILTMAQVRPEAFKVVFHARPPDIFFDTLTINETLDPRIILAVKANGTLLTTVSEIYPDHIGGYRLVVPGRWGYKWVANVGSIEVVDHDVLGTYETDHIGPDEALIPDNERTQGYVLPASVKPPLQVFTLTFGNRTFQLEAFTNASIAQFKFDPSQKTVYMNVSIPSSSVGFADFIIPQDMLKGPYTVTVDGKAANVREANATDREFQYIQFSPGMHAVHIVGSEFFGKLPTPIIGPLNQPVHVGDTVIFDASESVDEGVIISYNWDFGDGTNGTGLTSSHRYNREGVYQVKLNVTDNQGFSNPETLTVTVERVPLDVALIIKVGLLAAVILFAIAFAFLILTKRRAGDRNKTS